MNVERIADQWPHVGVYTLSVFDKNIMNSHHDYIHELHQGKDELFNTAYQNTHEKYFGRLAGIEK